LPIVPLGDILIRSILLSENFPPSMDVEEANHDKSTYSL